MKQRNIYTHDSGQNLDGTQRRVVYTCKTFNSANKSSRCRRIADNMQERFMQVVKRNEQAEKVEQFEQFKLTRSIEQKLKRQARRKK